MPDIVPDDDPFIRSLQEAGIRPPRGPRGAGTGRPPRSPRLGIIVAAILFGVLVLLPGLTTPLADWLWFTEIRFQRVFLTKITAQWTIGLLSGAVAFAVLYGNARYALRGLVDGEPRVREPITDIAGVATAVGAQAARLMRTLALPWTALIAFVVALSMASQWNTALQAMNRTPFGVTDPIFGRDVGYYVFVLPAIEAIVGFAFALVLLSLLLVAIPIHFARAEAGRGGEVLVIPAFARQHLAILAALALLVIAARTQLVSIPGILFGEHLALSGANYVDLHVRVPAMHVLSAAALAGAALIAWSGTRGRIAFVAARVVAGYAILVVLSILVPAAYQRLVVQANELSFETPQIAHHIKGTRDAWGIADVQLRELGAATDLTPATIAANRATIDNVRLWDREPLLQTFGQLQSIRTYYDFVSVDDDRYRIGGQLRQVMLSARELNTEALPTKGFINEHLTYTHGMGVTLGPSNEVTAEGLPVLLIKDLPPVSSIPLPITRPQIYYGEQSNDFVLAPSRQREFDYPAGEGDAAVYSSYDGRGGVPVASFARRLLYALHFGSFNILLTRDVTERTRILYHRSIGERVRRALPFLLFDRDPYMVVTDDGRLKWLVDGYTSTDRYPYSAPVSGINYMRNTVKVVIDAYDGDLTAFVAAPDDPIVQTLAKIYPGVLRPLAEMPAALRAHVRYPEDLFRVQTALYATYHMGNPETFYHREDQWQVPGAPAISQSSASERGPGSARVAGESFLRHMVMRLPGEQTPEFILMRPFTPRQKDNLAAWMVARNDGAAYGKLAVYRFPRQSLVFGPNQIANRINQDTEVSRQISLWDQRGSEVLRGELLVIPIEGSLLYVQPLYLRAQGGRIPELKRVVVAQEGEVAMAETLDAALRALFGAADARAGAGAISTPPDSGARAPARAADTSVAATGPTADLARRANEHFERARAAQRADDWATYGAEMRRLGEVLRQLGAQRSAVPR
ncbi:MAG TPA: UPF0182 family protein [Gemmatimonadaceae bacterium]|nr:UPF0182 family protein [Gemmatimonadaceae bacterium]